MPKKILFIRLDKIGDLVCTLCVDEHPDLKEYSKYWLIAKGLEFIPEQAVPQRVFSSLTKDRQGFKHLFNFLKSTSFDASISFQCPWWVHLLLFYFRIPIRVGVLSQWHSFLFLNTGLRQKRSQATQHESSYNYELVDHLAQKLKAGNYAHVPIRKSHLYEVPILKLIAKTDKQLLEKWNLRAQSYFIIHPGMAGSSLNWPQSKYIQFIYSFHAFFPNQKVVLTGTPGDTPYLDKITSEFSAKDFFVNLQSQLTANELLSVLSTSSGVLAPSTGVMHLAASLGVATFGIFSPVTVQRPIRWGPRGRSTKIYEATGSENDPDCMARLDIFPEFKTDFIKTLKQ